VLGDDKIRRTSEDDGLKIEAIRIQSFKSFADTGWVELSPHFTVLVGQNNSGKSAFLRAFNSASSESSPHRSASRPEGRILPPTVISFRLAVEGREVAERARSGGLWLPVNQHNDVAIIKAHLVDDRVHTLETKTGIAPILEGAPSYGLFDTEDVWSMSVGVDDQTGEFQLQTTMRRSPPEDSLPDFVAELLRRTTFVFNAERYSIGRSPMQAYDRLSADASNLPYMLLRLNKDYARMERFQALVSEVLPNVKRVAVSTVGNDIEISIHSHGSYREDLAVPLNESGTGLAQVLAILYVVVTYPTAQIIVDEPNSFLHPGATRRLLAVLRRFDQHQYLLTTHTADVIAATQPEKLLLLRWDEEESQTVIVSNSGATVEHIRASLSEIGATLSDVFGFDLVVFVEGPTERECFPLFVPPENRAAVNFVAMKEPSSLTSRKSGGLFDIYSRGVAGSALLPPRTRFSFDRDGRTATEVADTVRTSKGAAFFLDRPMYESYLLHPTALSTLLQRLDGASDANSAAAVGQWLSENYKTFEIKGLPASSSENCDAARLLDAMFKALTEARYEYKKVEHGKELSEWILANDDQAFAELKAHIASLVKP